jgi:hypothetical protein
MSLFRRISKCVPNSNLQLARTFRPSLVTRITSFLLDISVEATARPFREWYGQGPYMTQGHLQLAHAPTADWCQPRTFKSAGTLPQAN